MLHNLLCCLHSVKPSTIKYCLPILHATHSPFEVSCLCLQITHLQKEYIETPEVPSQLIGRIVVLQNYYFIRDLHTSVYLPWFCLHVFTAGKFMFPNGIPVIPTEIRKFVHMFCYTVQVYATVTSR